MQRILAFAASALVFLAGSLAISAQDKNELVTGVRMAQPLAWIQFCRDYPAACIPTPGTKELVSINPQTRRQLESVNSSVNKSITPVTDRDHWGTRDRRYVHTYPNVLIDVDRWDYAEDGRGDCEDYALLKQRELLKIGLPRTALLITVVKSYVMVNGNKVLEGHAVLTVRTNEGDFILTNETNAIRRWWETEYQFIKRQSEGDPNVWLALVKPQMSSIANAK